MKTLVEEFNARSNIALTLDPIISFKNIYETRFKLIEAKKQIKELEKILTCIYDEYALSLERDDILIQSALQETKEK